MGIDLALAAAAEGRYVEAGRATASALAILRAAYGADSPALIQALGVTGLHATARGELPAAEQAYADAARIVAAAWGADHPMNAQLALLRADVQRRDGHAAEAVALARPARALVARTADARDLGLAYADAILARALHELPDAAARAEALAAARGAVARCDAPGAALPAGPCAIVYQALGEISPDPAEAAAALDAGLQLLAAGAADPVRLAELRLARAERLLPADPRAARALAQLASAELPAQGDRALAASITRWLALHKPE